MLLDGTCYVWLVAECYLGAERKKYQHFPRASLLFVSFAMVKLFRKSKQETDLVEKVIEYNRKVNCKTILKSKVKKNYKRNPKMMKKQTKIKK